MDTYNAEELEEEFGIPFEAACQICWYYGKPTHQTDRYKLEEDVLTVLNILAIIKKAKEKDDEINRNIEIDGPS